MTQYLISFDDGAMTFPEEEWPDVAEAALAAVQAIKDAGVWVFDGGLKDHEEVSVVATDGMVTDGPYLESKEYLGGFVVVDVPHARRRWGGLPRSPSPAAVLKWSASSWPTRPCDRMPTTAGSCPPLPNGTARPGIARPPRPSQLATRMPSAPCRVGRGRKLAARHCLAPLDVRRIG